MAWDPINEAELNPGYAVLKHMRQAWNCLKHLYGTASSGSGSAGIPNASFETDSDSNGVPDNWTFTAYPGGSSTIETAAPAHGSKAVKIIHPGGAGNGGGYLESDYVEVSQYEIAYNLRFLIWSSVSGMKNQAYIRWFNKDKTYLSETSIYSATTSTTTPTWQGSTVAPPANARYAKIKLVGGFTDTNVAGSIWFDGCEFRGATPTTQVFTASGTWTKPGVGTQARIQAWGGGGCGKFFWGGGGGYAELIIPLAMLSSTTTVTVGAGGTSGNDGGTSSFGSLVAGYGGGGGAAAEAAESSYGGGGGGGYSTIVVNGGIGNRLHVTSPGSSYAGGGGGGGGASVLGGSGGGYGGSGVIPGGGGGVSDANSYFSGARGEVRITIW